MKKPPIINRFEQVSRKKYRQGVERRLRQTQRDFYSEERDPHAVMLVPPPVLGARRDLLEWYWRGAWAIRQESYVKKNLPCALAALREMRAISDVMAHEATEKLMQSLEPGRPAVEAEEIQMLDDAQAEGRDILARFQQTPYREDIDEPRHKN